MDMHDSTSESPNNFAVVRAGRRRMAGIEQQPDRIIRRFAKRGNFLAALHQHHQVMVIRKDDALAASIGRRIPPISSGIAGKIN